MTEISPYDLIGAEVVMVDRGVSVEFDRLFLKLKNGRLAIISPLYDEGLFIDEGDRP